MTDRTLMGFILAMLKSPADRLATASADKLARKYGIPASWAQFYLNAWSNR